MTSLSLTLPFPPSANHMYARRRGGGVMLSPAARAFRLAVQVRVLEARVPGDRKPLKGMLAVEVQYFRPHKRYDVDNFQKPLLDALQSAGVFTNDQQVDDLHSCRMLCAKSCAPFVRVAVKELP